MSQLKPQFELYYQATRKRSGLMRLKEILEGGDVDVNASLNGLPPVLFTAIISYDQEIFELLLAYGADPEMTPGRAKKILIDPLVDQNKALVKRIGGTVLGFLSKQNNSLGRTARSLGLNTSKLTSEGEDAQDIGQRAEDFVEKEQQFWKELGGQYYEDMTVFAAAVLREGKHPINSILKNHRVNPNPVLKGVKLSELMRQAGRDYMAEQLEEAEKTQ